MRRGTLTPVLAALGAACGPSPEAPGEAATDPRPPVPWFRDVAASAGVTFRHESDASGAGRRFPEIMGGGAALLDLEGDGDLDLYLVQSGELDAPGEGTPANALYANDGRARFTDVTVGSGADDRGYGMGAAAGDLDGDGRTDLYVTNLRANVLLASRGDRTFADVTDAAAALPVWSTSAAPADLDADGDLDLFVCNYVGWSPEREIECFGASGRPDYCSPNSYGAPLADTLLRNEGDGTFTDVSAPAGLSERRGNGLGVVTGDLDGDGRTDVFVANDQMENHLWINRGGLAFDDVAPLVGVAVDQHGSPKAGMGTLAEDVDDDGDLDLLVVNLRAQSDSFFRNEGTYFVDDTAAVGLGSATRPYTRFGVGWLDLDNDGWLDLYEASGRVALLSEEAVRSSDPYAEPNVLLAGGPGPRFVPLVPEGGVVPPLVHTSRATAFGDLDDDGGVDVVVVNRDAAPYVLHNVVPDRGHWLRLRVLDASGRDALGAVLHVELGDRTLRREVRSAYGYCAANDPRVHVGLGDLTRVDAVRVRWPTGRERTFGPFDADREETLRPGP